VQIVGKRVGVLELFLEFETWVLGYCVWRVDSQSVGSPCGLIALARGWFVVDIWNISTYGWEVHPFYVSSWIIFIYI
jgi:hypothetical protein